MTEKSTTSNFANALLNETLENNEIMLLEQWEETFGKYNLDYVNVVKYPDGYVNKVEAMDKKINVDNNEIRRKFEAELEKLKVNITRDSLREEQRKILDENDTEIKRCMDDAVEFLQQINLELKVEENETELNDNKEKICKKMINQGLFSK